MELVEQPATVTQGYRVASGLCGDPRFPEGTIAPQLAFFRAAVSDLDGYLGGTAYPGTINLAVGGAVVLGTPEIVLHRVAWSEHVPPENFFLSRAALVVRGNVHPAFLYIPDPATKPGHVQRTDIVELLAARIDDLAYGDAVTLRHAPTALKVVPAR